MSHHPDEPLDDVDGPAHRVDAVAVREDDPSGSGLAPADEPARRRRLPIWQESALLLAVAVVLAVVIKALFVQAFYIPSESMEPGLVENDRILVQKVSYWFDGSPSRGDVVVFEDPGGWLDPAESAGPTNGVGKLMAKVGLYPSGGHLVKRVIGVEGDVIECCDDQGRLLLNGEPLDEDDYVQAEAGVECRGPMPGCDWKVGPIPEGQLFVMGDNRNHSSDSSAHLCTADETECHRNPYVDTELVVGKVFLLAWPRDRFDWLDRPDSFADVAEAPAAGE
ncbi:signal peptidase I [Nocardioides sp. cx-173]|uniref:signal peptidase I n=1 Tax=Nocardioides sp. cx-173 TaxID=2898796 RepID=UPI001E30D316|nr:signal peptidase I [Nocardioides sp. cx-173]MCD4524781.1 signal peptidase I [Nocardioides sp. cx-173]UGB43289.1 signal peptidase I [Nocardioides sp. cx-173]